MGQSIVVNEKPSPNRGVVRFETNRALTGMAHERYLADTEVWGERPPDELARRILARGGVIGLQINANMVTVDLERGWDATGIKAIIENLYRFYPDQPDAPGGSAVADAPSPDAAVAPEQVAVPADGTPATVEDAPAHDEVEGAMSTAADVAATDEPAEAATPGAEPVPAAGDPAPEPGPVEAGPPPAADAAAPATTEPVPADPAAVPGDDAPADPDTEARDPDPEPDPATVEAAAAEPEPEPGATSDPM
jgi:hypothetical protein